MNHSTPVNAGSTIYDVAERAGVSIATVSRYLNNPERLSAETAQKVQSAVDHLAYIPHGNTGPKAKRSVGRIAVLTPFFPAPSFVQRLQGMTPVFRRSHCEMVIHTIDSPEQLRDSLHSIPFSKRLDGLIILSMRIGDADAERLHRSGLEVVLVEQHHPLFSSVEADNRRGGALAAEHLLARGLTPCGFLGEEGMLPYSLQPSELRWEGFRKALDDASASVLPDRIGKAPGTVEAARAVGRQWLARPDRPRSVFAMSDLQAIGLLKAARDVGLRVPEDVAIMGFDDIEAADYMDLTTVSQSLGESGRLAAELLLDRIREPGRPLQSIQLRVAVVPRATT